MLKDTFSVVVLSPDKFTEWNEFVDSSPQGDVFCYSWWLDAITHSRFKIFIAIENGKIVAGMPLAFDREGKINEPPLTRTLGILYTPQPLTYKSISDQRRWSAAFLEKINVEDFVQTCTHHNFTDWLPYRWKGLSQTTRYTYLLSYEGKTIEDLKKSLESGCRNVINRAERNKLNVEESSDLQELYHLVSLTYGRQGLKFRIPIEELMELDDSIKSNGKRVILRVKDCKNNALAAIYIAFNKKSAYFLLSGGDPEYRNLGGHTLVFWEAIKYFRSKVSYCNFGGSDISRIESHLRCFGGVLTPYFHIYNEHATKKGIRYHLKELAFHSNRLLKMSAEKIIHRHN